MGDNSTARASATGHDTSVAYAGKNATATASSAQNGKPASVTCGGGSAYAANQSGRTFCFSGKYYSFTYAPNKVDLQLDLPTPPKKSSSSHSSSAQKASSSSSGKSSSSTESKGSKDSSRDSSTNSGSTKLVALTKKN